MKLFRQLIEEAATESEFSPSLPFFREIWDTLVPAEIARQTRPCGWANATLHVEVAPSWLGEIRRQKRTIVSRVKSQLPWPLNDIIFVEGFFETSAEEPAAPTPAPLAVDAFDDVELNSLAGTILGHIRAESE